MIEQICDCDKSYIFDLLLKDKYQNPYMYIDTLVYGFQNENVKAWKVFDSGAVLVIYKYYDSLQLFSNSTLSDSVSSEVAAFIHRERYEMVTGKADIIESISNYLDDYDTSIGCIMSYDEKKPSITDINIKVATIPELEQAASLVCSDKNSGGHYTISQLTKQFVERKLHYGCTNVIYKQSGEILCHAATYAETDSFAIIGGIITDLRYRGRGLAGITTKYLVSKLLQQEKKPLIYCYDKHLEEWYVNLGFSVITKCGKLERKR